MITLFKTILLTAVLAAFGLPAAAQWPAYPSPNVPRKVDGTPDMSAPAPRAADGHPDLTGLWEIYFQSIAAAPPAGQAGPSRSQQSPGDGGQLGLTPSTPPKDPKAPPRATFF